MPAPAPHRRRALFGARRLRVWASCAVLFGCAPDPLDYSGKKCSAERPCPTSYTCNTSGTCDYVGPNNLVKNPGFEEGTTGWKVSAGTIRTYFPGRSSAAAGNWEPDGTAESVLTTVVPSVERAANGTWYCARAWLMGTDTGAVSLLIVEGQTVAASEPEPLVDGQWIKLTTNTLSSGDPLSIGLRSSAAQGDRTIYVDDLALWESPDVTCSGEP